MYRNPSFLNFIIFLLVIGTLLVTFAGCISAMAAR